MRLAQSAGTTASPAQVWEVLGDPTRWPEVEPFLRRVRGTRDQAAAGQVLVGVSRIASLAVPIDVLEAVAPSRLVLRVHTAPGVRQTITHEVVPRVRGGSDIHVAVVLEGPLAVPLAGPLWLSSSFTLRLLVARVARIARAARRAA